MHQIQYAIHIMLICEHRIKQLYICAFISNCREDRHFMHQIQYAIHIILICEHRIKHLHKCSFTTHCRKDRLLCTKTNMTWQSLIANYSQLHYINHELSAPIYMHVSLKIKIPYKTGSVKLNNVFIVRRRRMSSIEFSRCV